MRLKESIIIILSAIGILAAVILLTSTFFKPISNDEYTVPEDLTELEGYSELEGYTSESMTEEDYTPLATAEPASVTPAPVETTVPTASAVTDGVDTSLFIPDKYPKSEDCGQFLLLKSVDYNGILFFYTKENGNWKLVSMCTATLGKNGVTDDKKEGDGCTPRGEYPLLFVMGESKPITDMRFEKLVSGSIWVDDAESKYYNTLEHVNSRDNDWRSFEKLYERYFRGGTHKHMIYIGYNGDGLTPGTAERGKGSMITLCGKTEGLDPTGGCIDILDTDMTKLLQYLKPEQNPVIIIE